MENRKSPTELVEIDTISFVEIQITKNIRDYKNLLIELRNLKQDIEYNEKERKDELEKANTKVREDIIKKEHEKEILEEKKVIAELEKRLSDTKDPYFIKRKISKDDFKNYLTLTGKTYEQLKAEAAEDCDEKLLPQNRIRKGGRTRKSKKSKKTRKTRKMKGGTPSLSEVIPRIEVDSIFTVDGKEGEYKVIRLSQEGSIYIINSIKVGSESEPIKLNLNFDIINKEITPGRELLPTGVLLTPDEEDLARNRANRSWNTNLRQERSRLLKEKIEKHYPEENMGGSKKSKKTRKNKNKKKGAGPPEKPESDKPQPEQPLPSQPKSKILEAAQGLLKMSKIGEKSKENKK